MRVKPGDPVDCPHCKGKSYVGMETQTSAPYTLPLHVIAMICPSCGGSGTAIVQPLEGPSVAQLFEERATLTGEMARVTAERDKAMAEVDALLAAPAESKSRKSDAGAKPHG